MKLAEIPAVPAEGLPYHEVSYAIDQLVPAQVLAANAAKAYLLARFYGEPTQMRLAELTYAHAVLQLLRLEAIANEYAIPAQWISSEDALVTVVPQGEYDEIPVVRVHNDGWKTIQDYQGSPIMLVGVEQSRNLFMTEVD